MCRKERFDMRKRQENKKNRNKKEKPVKDDSTFSIPNIVAEPKTQKEKDDKTRQVNREKNEIYLEAKYLDSIQKLSSTDLGKSTLKARSPANNTLISEFSFKKISCLPIAFAVIGNCS